MLRISKMTDYATVILAHLAGDEAGRRTAVELAELTQHRARDDQQGAEGTAARRARRLDARRRTAAIALARPAAAISAAEIIDAVEGPVGAHRVRDRTRASAASSRAAASAGAGSG